MFAHFICLLVLPFSPQPCGFVEQCIVLRIGLASIPFGVRWDERFFDVLIQLVQVNVTQNWADYATLRGSAQCGVVLPLFEISCLKEFTDKAKKPSIVDVLCQRVEQDLMVQVESRWSACARFTASRSLHRAPSN
jgi:hypothetical protein